MTSQLADFARAVRLSTITHLELVPLAWENWRVDQEAMSFADTAQHLIDSDGWLLETLRSGVSRQMVDRAKWTIVRGTLDHESHHPGQLIAYLRALRRVRTDESLGGLCDDPILPCQD